MDIRTNEGQHCSKSVRAGQPCIMSTSMISEVWTQACRVSDMLVPHPETQSAVLLIYARRSAVSEVDNG
jgi:hypothetical protein